MQPIPQLPWQQCVKKTKTKAAPGEFCSYVVTKALSVDLKNERSSFGFEECAESNCQSNRWKRKLIRLISDWRFDSECLLTVSAEMSIIFLKKTTKNYLHIDPENPAVPAMSFIRGGYFIFSYECSPISVTQRDRVGSASLVWGLWLSAEKLSKFDSSQVCSEMPFFKRQKAFASDSRVP